MKATNSFVIRDKRGFQFLIPFTMVIMVAISLLIIGAFAVGEIADSLENTMPDNLKSREIDNQYFHNGTTINSSRNVSLPCAASLLYGATTKFTIKANGTANPWFNFTVQKNEVNKTSQLTAGQWTNITLTTMIANGNVSNSDRYLNFSWNVSTNQNQVVVRVFGIYATATDWRSADQNKTMNITGNITEGFSDVVDIEIVVMVITAIAMAVFVLMALATRRESF